MTYHVIVKKLELLQSELLSHVPFGWCSWSFGDLLEALRKWTGMNPVVETFGKGTNPKRSTLPSDCIYHSQDRYVGNCVYCDSGEHRSSGSDKLSTLDARKAFLANKRLCFNCAAGQHSANQCPSKLSCRVCRRRHHTSICQQASVDPNLTANIVGSSVIHPVVIVNVCGHKFCALLDSGASHSYMSSTLVELTRVQAVKSGTRRVATLLGVATTKLLEYDLCLRSVYRNFELNTHVTQINKRELLTLDNPCYADCIAGHSHLYDVHLEDHSRKITCRYTSS